MENIGNNTLKYKGKKKEQGRGSPETAVKELSHLHRAQYLHSQERERGERVKGAIVIRSTKKRWKGGFSLQHCARVFLRKALVTLSFKKIHVVLLQ